MSIFRSDRLRGHRWAIMITLSLGFFMTLLDLTIVNVAVPNMIAKLHASLDTVSWVLNSDVLALAVLLITTGRLGDLWGPRTLFLLGIGGFVVASMACAAAQDVGQLIAARSLQGVGAALLLPQTISIIIATFPAERRGVAMGVWGVVAGLATVAGPTVGGLLVTWADWRWIFLINLPIGLVVLALGVVVLPLPAARARVSFDVVGVGIASAGLVCLTYGLVEGQRYGWGTVWSWVTIPRLLALGLLLLVAFAVQQGRRQHRDPLVPFDVLRDRNFSIMTTVSALVQVGMMGVFLPMILFMQSVLGFSALKAGLTTVPLSVATMIVAPGAGRLVDRIGGKFVLITGLLFFGAGVAHLSWVAAPSNDWQDFVPGMALCGAGMGAIFGPMQTIATYGIPPERAGAASGLLNTARQLGAVLGSAGAVALLENRSAAALRDAVAAHAASIPPPVRGPFVAALESRPVGSGLPADLAPLLPPGTPSSVVRQLGVVTHQIFADAFVNTLHPTLALPIAGVVLGALACIGVQGRRAVVPSPPVPATAAAQA